MRRSLLAAALALAGLLVALACLDAASVLAVRMPPKGSTNLADYEEWQNDYNRRTQAIRERIWKAMEARAAARERGDASEEKRLDEVISAARGEMMHLFKENLGTINDRDLAAKDAGSSSAPPKLTEAERKAFLELRERSRNTGHRDFSPDEQRLIDRVSDSGEEL